MGNLLSYSGISAKIRAMQSKLTTEKQLLEILQLSDVPQVIAYLKRTPEYAEAVSYTHLQIPEPSLKYNHYGSSSRSFSEKPPGKVLTLYLH